MPLLVFSILSSSAQAGFPSSTYPECSNDGTLNACPPDMLNSDGTWRGITWSFVSLIPPGLEKQVRPEELKLGSGNWLDKAVQLTVGRYDVPIAVVDSGIRWYKEQITPKVLLNRGELPGPQGTDGKVCTDWDCNRDGYFTVADYANDVRVRIDAGAEDAHGQLEPSDLIATFSDGIDGDANGYIDDIGGWDFLWDDNDPRASNDFYHGSAVITDAAATAGDVGSDMGYCPNCSIIPVRASDSFMGEGNKIALGLIYAVDRGAKVVGIAMGGITHSDFLRDAYAYAYANGVTVVTAIGDELSYHHLPPGSIDYSLPVHSIEFYPVYGLEFARSFLAYNGCNNYGAHLALVAATNDCATGSVAVISGIAGLVYSRARDNGIELSADEARAILTNSATDINVRESQTGTSAYFPSYPGWDQFFGYGRVNARHAVDLAQPYRIPPEVQIHRPSFYDYIDASRTSEIVVDAHLAAPRADDYSWRLEWAPGADARDSSFSLLTNGTRSSALNGVIYRWPVASIPLDKLDPAAPIELVTGDDPLLRKLEKVNAHTMTLRLVAEDNQGNRAEHRKTFFLHADPDLVSGFPVVVGPGESSPVLFDLDGDGKLEIVVGTSDGIVHLIDANGRYKSGWPVKVGEMPSMDQDNPEHHLGSAPYALDGLEPASQGILGQVNVADLEGDGLAEVLVSTLDGWLYVFTANGKQKPGFPVTRDPISDEDTDPTHQYDPGMAAAPVPADLDGDGRLEIVLPAMDQKLYAWRFDGTRQPGFPVKLEHDDSSNNNQGRIFSTPAIGDINGDGMLEIVVGTNEYDEELPPFTFVYAVHGEGNAHPEGPLVNGWPVTVIGLLSGVVNYMGEGITMTPVMADIDSDGAQEIAVAAPGGCPLILNGRGRTVTEVACDEAGWGPLRNTDEVGGLTYLANLKFGDVNQDGIPELVGGMTCLNWGLSLLLNRWMPYQDHVVATWDSLSGDALPAWPRVIEDLMMFVTPEIADVTGDGVSDVLMSSGGYTVHAWEADGTVASGWPRFTGGWVYTAIRAGDLDGDDANEVVALTRKGYLFAWETDGIPSAIADLPASRTGITRAKKGEGSRILRQSALRRPGVAPESGR